MLIVVLAPAVPLPAVNAGRQSGFVPSESTRSEVPD